MLCVCVRTPNKCLSLRCCGSTQRCDKKFQSLSQAVVNKQDVSVTSLFVLSQVEQTSGNPGPNDHLHRVLGSCLRKQVPHIKH